MASYLRALRPYGTWPLEPKQKISVFLTWKVMGQSSSIPEKLEIEKKNPGMEKTGEEQALKSVYKLHSVLGWPMNGTCMKKASVSPAESNRWRQNWGDNSPVAPYSESRIWSLNHTELEILRNTLGFHWNPRGIVFRNKGNIPELRMSP